MSSASAGPVVVDISMSVDGFVTAPDPDVDHGLGRGGAGERLHDWAVARKTDADDAILERSLRATGAVLMGRRTFDVVDGPHGWNDEMAFAAARREGLGRPANVVVTHSVPAEVRLVGAFEFVTGGVAAAVARGQAIADGREVTVMGGADLCRQVLLAGLADELRLHVAPIVLGAGTPLFRAADAPIPLEVIDTVQTPAATHLHYRVPRA